MYILKIIYITVIIITSICACTYKTKSQSKQAENQYICLADSLNVDPEILQQLRAYNVSKFEDIKYWIHPGAYLPEEIEFLVPVFLDGFTFKYKHSDPNEIFQSLKDSFLEKGYIIVVVQIEYGGSDILAVLKTTDKNQVIKQMLIWGFVIDTDNLTGETIEIDSDTIIDIVKYLDKKYSLELELYYASRFSLEFVINGSVEDWDMLAGEVSKICPDIIDPSNRSVTELAQEMKENRRMPILWK